MKRQTTVIDLGAMAAIGLRVTIARVEAELRGLKLALKQTRKETPKAAAKKKMSAAARKLIGDRMRAYWAKKRKGT